MGVLRALRWPAYRRVWLTATLMQFGYWFSSISFQWLVARETDNDPRPLSHRERDLRRRSDGALIAHGVDRASANLVGPGRKLVIVQDRRHELTGVISAAV